MYKPIVGIRPGEKIHEEMISISDSLNTYDYKYFVILPENPIWNLKDFLKNNGERVKYGFSYNSGENTEWETIEF